jgi:prepilin-type N-terminal cleavage/methylation domain-containing protein
VRKDSGFSLVEMAIVLVIVGLLISSTLGALTAQAENRNHLETKRILESAREALLGFAIANRRLPCPAIEASTGVESPAGGTCTTNFAGYLPARTLGLQPTNESGYAIDAWGNPIRYAVAASVTAATGGTCAATPPHFTSQLTLKANGLSCVPSDLDVICSTAAPGAGLAAACNSTIYVASQKTIAFIVLSTGKNGAVTSTAPDEAANTDGNAIFVSRTPSSSDSPLGAYDDLMVMVPVGVLYGKLVAAGALP